MSSVWFSVDEFAQYHQGLKTLIDIMHHQSRKVLTHWAPGQFT